jgi:XTP/dITP diphosphohydrolase
MAGVIAGHSLAGNIAFTLSEMELVLATNNAGKLHEIKSLLPDFTLLTLKDIGFTESIPEPYDTFRENAWTKANTIYNYCGKPVMADDSGLCVDVLNGAPGVFSARYAGEHATDDANLQLVLKNIEGIDNRKAHYTAVICLMMNDEPHYFEGHCYGAIMQEPIGTDGFGYDPIFRPDGYTQTFGELPLSVKNTLSHRGAAIREMVRFLNDLS